MVDDGGVLVSRDGFSWSAPEVVAYDNEAHLQHILSSDPERVPGVSEGARTAEELPTSAGPVDVCIVGSDGSITVVECKLASSAERRRMVIGQVIDYAAAICKDGPDAFLDSWRRRGADLADVLDPTALEQLRRNIADGRIDLCLAVDQIDVELRRLVEYLNLATRADVMVTALQLSYARDGDTHILIPSTYGGELAAAKVERSSRSTERWTWDAFVAWLASDEDKQFASYLHDRLHQLDDRRGTHDLLWFGTKPGGGVYFHPFGFRSPPFQLWSNRARELMVYGNWGRFSAIADHPGFASLAELLGQDHHGGSSAVRASTLDLETFWTTAVQCAIAINE